MSTCHECSMPLMTPSYLHMPSVKNRQGRLAPDPFSKTKVFCFVILNTLAPNAYLFPYQVLCVMYLWATDFWVLTAGRRMPIQHFFYRLSPMVSCLNHIPSLSPKGVSIPTCFSHLHMYFSCHVTMNLNLDIVPFD